MTDNIVFNKNRVFKNGQVLYEFNGNIEKILLIDPLIFVLIEHEREVVDNKNLLCISAHGKLVWQCEDMLANRPPDSLEPPYAHYLNIWLQDNQLWGSNYFGTHENRLDISTGKIIESHYIK